MIKKLTYGMAAASFAALLSTTAANAGLVIDDFSTALSGTIATADADPATSYNSFSGLSVGGGSAVNDLSAGTGILGGDRELQLDHTNTAGSVGALVAGGYFSHSNSSLATGTSLLRWDGAGNGVATNDLGLTDGAGGIDLTSFGSYFHLTVISSDLTGSSMQVRLYTSLGDYSIASVAIPRVPADVLSPFEFYLSLADIAAGVGNPLQGAGVFGLGVNLTDVRAIEWFANGGVNFDATIDIVDIVPEPASMTLLGAGLMGLGYFGKRRKA